MNQNRHERSGKGYRRVISVLVSILLVVAAVIPSGAAFAEEAAAESDEAVIGNADEEADGEAQADAVA